MATPTSHRPYKRAYQKASPRKGAEFVATGKGMESAPEKTAAWPAPDKLGNSKQRLRGVERVKTRMWEQG